MFIQNQMPRYRGFNIIDLFVSESSHSFNPIRQDNFREIDFKLISEWGFNFVRVPVSYRVWSTPEDPYTVDESKISILDKAVQYAEKYNLHINIGFHRIPGYCVNDDEPVKEPFDLWKDSEALEAAAFQWRTLALRYKNISNERLSFNIVNEPAWGIPESKVTMVTSRLIKEIRRISPERTIHIDGRNNGNHPPIGLLSTDFENCCYSCRGYQPGSLTHYNASFTSQNLANTPPVWPGAKQLSCGEKIIWDRAKIDQYFDLWAAISNVYNSGVICGEMGCYNKTPHKTTLAWFEDILGSLKEHNIGFAVWNLRGPFGIINSGRTDVDYEELENGDKLDRKLLELLQKY